MRIGLPVVYEVGGFWEDTWLSRHPDAAERAGSELYQRNRELETRCRFGSLRRARGGQRILSTGESAGRSRRAQAR